MEQNVKTLIDLGFEESVVFDNPSFDTAIIGTTEDGRVVYSFEKMVEALMSDEEIPMTAEEAEDFICCNTLRSLPYIENAPIIVYNTNQF